MTEENPGIIITTNDASVMRVVQQVDGVEQDITPAPEPEPTAAKTGKKNQGGKANVDEA